MALQRCPGTPIGLGIPQAKCLPREPMWTHLPPLDFSFHFLSGSHSPQPQSYLRTLKTVMLVIWSLAPWLIVEVAGTGQCFQSRHKLEAGLPSAAGQSNRICPGKAPFSRLSCNPACLWTLPVVPRKGSALTHCMQPSLNINQNIT